MSTPTEAMLTTIERLSARVAVLEHHWNKVAQETGSRPNDFDQILKAYINRDGSYRRAQDLEAKLEKERKAHEETRRQLFLLRAKMSEPMAEPMPLPVDDAVVEMAIKDSEDIPF